MKNNNNSAPYEMSGKHNDTLVRHGVPDRIRQRGDAVIVKHLNTKEFSKLLDETIRERVNTFLSEPSNRTIAADLIELILTKAQTKQGGHTHKYEIQEEIDRLLQSKGDYNDKIAIREPLRITDITRTDTDVITPPNFE